VKDQTKGDEWITLGQQLRQARVYRELTQKDVAETLGFTMTMVNKHEAGTRTISVDKLHGYCQLYNWSFEKVMTFVGLEADALANELARGEYTTMVQAIRPLITAEEGASVFRLFGRLIQRRHPDVRMEDFTQRVYTKPGEPFLPDDTFTVSPGQDMLPEPDESTDA
jgi:transcriptional regulator with XRE-family HTH domain